MPFMIIQDIYLLCMELRNTYDHFFKTSDIFLAAVRHIYAQGLITNMQ